MANIETTAKILGYAGLVPFFALATLSHQPGFGLTASAAQTGLTTYGAIIVSFMAALQWGYALIAPWRNPNTASQVMAWSVVAPLAAWFAIWQLQAAHIHIVLAACLCAVAYVDHCLRDERWFPGWFWRLRVHLTVGAVASLLVGASKA